MKHFQDDNYDSMNEYENSVPKHFQDEDSDDWEGSLVFRHWNE